MKTDDELRRIQLENRYKRMDLSWQQEVRLKRDFHRLCVKMYGKRYRGQQRTTGHTIEDTAEQFNESKTNTSRDIKIAKALDNIPHLSDYPNKTQAIEELNRIIEETEDYVI